MSTKKPLQALVPELLSYIKVQSQNQIIYNKKIFEIYNGNLLKHVEESLKKDLNPLSYERSLGRIAPINILNKVVEKLSRVYSNCPVRSAGDNEIDNELIAFYEDELELNKNMAIGNELLNLHKYFAVEPYLDEEGEPGMRLLSADKFLVWSDSSIDPTDPTVFIKFMGSIVKTATPKTDKQGRLVKSAEQEIREVALYHVYSSDEFMILDADGEITELRDNPYGVIPFTYCNSSSFELMPTPDSDNLAMTVLIPKLLTDINYAVGFQSHSIVYGIDCDIDNLTNSPDAFWKIKSGEDGKVGSIGTIKPEVDTDKVIALIQSEMTMWLDSKGIKSGASGAIDGASASGISKMIDEGDASAITKKQKNLFQDFESDLWDLIQVMHGYWVSTQQLAESQQDFSIDFEPRIAFEEHKIVADDKSKLEEVKLMFDMGLTTPRMALKKLYPEASDSDIESMLQEIADFKAGAVEAQSNAVKAIIGE